MLIKPGSIGTLLPNGSEGNRTPSTGKPAGAETPAPPSVDHISMSSSESFAADRANKLSQIKKLVRSPGWEPLSSATAQTIVSDALSRAGLTA